MWGGGGGVLGLALRFEKNKLEAEFKYIASWTRVLPSSVK